MKSDFVPWLVWIIVLPFRFRNVIIKCCLPCVIKDLQKKYGSDFK